MPAAKVEVAAVANPTAAVAAGDDNLDELIQLSDELTAKATIGSAGAAGQRPRHASSSSDVSSEGKGAKC